MIGEKHSTYQAFAMESPTESEAETRSPFFTVNRVSRNIFAEDKGHYVTVLEIGSETRDYVIRQISLRDLLINIQTELMELEGEKGKKRTTSKNGDDGGVEYLVPEIKARDLRRLEYSFGLLEEPTVMVRRHVVLLSFDPYRVIVLSNRIIVIVPQGGSDSLLNNFRDSLQSWKNERGGDAGVVGGGIPFEAHVYETIITGVIRLLCNDYQSTERIVLSVLRRFKQATIVSIDVQETMRLLKIKLQSMAATVASYRRCLTDLLEDDETMAFMNLSKLRQFPSYYTCDDAAFKATHQEIEVLLESYLADYNSLAMKMSLLQQSLQSAEELWSLRLDTSRNQLLVADTILSVVAICFSIGSFVGSLLGMNLYTGVEQTQGVFAAVTCVTLIAMTIIGVGIIVLFQKLSILPTTMSEPLSPLSAPNPFQLVHNVY